jgi:hypothetical protein
VRERQALARRSIADALTEQVQVGAPVHLPLEQLQAIDVAFGLALAPRAGSSLPGRPRDRSVPLPQRRPVPPPAHGCLLKPGCSIADAALVQEGKEGADALGQVGEQRATAQQLRDIGVVER